MGGTETCADGTISLIPHPGSTSKSERRPHREKSIAQRMAACNTVVAGKRAVTKTWPIQLCLDAPVQTSCEWPPQSLPPTTGRTRTPQKTCQQNKSPCRNKRAHHPSFELHRALRRCSGARLENICENLRATPDATYRHIYTFVSAPAVHH